MDEIIRAETARSGPLPFSRFMELALYHPQHGYYETEKHNPGRRGDYYTSVSAGSLFGRLLAWQFAKWLEAMPEARGGAQIVEAGAHDGQLAADILGCLQSEHPELFSALEYTILEPSARRQEWQRKTLKAFAPRVRWIADWKARATSPGQSPLPGVIFSNELLDAFPVRRFGWDAKERRWFEWGVATDGEQFVWTKMTGSGFRSPDPELETVLPDGYTVEISPAAENWWRAAAEALARGKLMAVDYGLTADELFSPARPRGTLRAYFRHHAVEDVLANPGEQDLTAHVNFSAIQKAGEDAGLKTEFFGSQAKFLTEILAAATQGDALGKWDGKQARQFQTLTHPEHLGRAFRVLVQSR